MRDPFNGVRLSVNCLDGNNNLMTLISAVVDSENKKNWLLLMDIIRFFICLNQLCTLDFKSYTY